MKFADHVDFGPSHPSSLTLLHAAAVAMDSAKTGHRLRVSASLLDGPPGDNTDYLNLSSASTSSSPLDASTLASSRILGRLKSMAAGSTSDLPSKRKSTTNHTNNRENLLDSHFLLEPEDFWRDLHNTLMMSWAERVKARNVDMARVLAMTHLSKRSRNVLIERHRLRYFTLFDKDAERLFDVLHGHMRDGSCKRLAELLQEEKDNDRQRMLRGERGEGGRRTHVETLKWMWMTCRTHLASIVYTVVYSNARHDNFRDTYPLSFCWELCGPELFHIKRGRVLAAMDEQELLPFTSAMLSRLCH